MLFAEMNESGVVAPAAEEAKEEKTRFLGPDCSLVRALVDMIRTGRNFEEAAEHYAVPKRHRQMVAKELAGLTVPAPTKVHEQEISLDLEPSFTKDTLRDYMEKKVQTLGPSMFFEKYVTEWGMELLLVATLIYDDPARPGTVVNLNGKGFRQGQTDTLNRIGVFYENGDRACASKVVDLKEGGQLKVYLWAVDLNKAGPLTMWVSHRDLSTNKSKDVKRVTVDRSGDPCGFSIKPALA